ncbi:MULTISPECIES: Bor family protein [unclassified Pseudoalteromonas]|uniref:Bor family protein n=1 Tax=unclassified Pseudoalteromonas TaxID=194690 RepID=UPI000B3C3E06|nr:MULTISPECIES: Bor family protein [unclassified Pseudoalteromonas]MDN3378615.1 Bor family protein [Pseudoalteromonas sp. APC 3893]MDN3386973.1 Bor family protein [Pseudoalteromonas sp. APC 4017]OUS71732.1 Bor family protein [Pseudoalteromonas sp. A601]
MRALITCSALLMLSACSSVTIQPQQVAKLSSKPSYQDSRPFFMWGLVGEQRVDVKQVCGEQDVVQMQSQQTFIDGALGLVTLGIYAPHTVKVWCNEQQATGEEA